MTLVSSGYCITYGHGHRPRAASSGAGPQSSSGGTCSLLPCGTFRCGRLTAPCPRCWCREASLLPRHIQPGATAGSPRSRSAASATRTTGEGSARRSFSGLTPTTSRLRTASGRKFRAASRKGTTPLIRSSGSSGCSRCASGSVSPASRTTEQSGKLKGGFLAGSPSDATAIHATAGFPEAD